MNTSPLYLGKALSIQRWQALQDALYVIGNIALLWGIMVMCLFGWAFID